MAHSHDRADGNYFLDQILIVAFCGALGIVMILLGVFNVLPIILNPKFHGPLLWGAIALLILVVIRAMSLWGEAGRIRLAHATAGDHAHDHEHCDHVHDHGHEHAHCEHDHDHDHAHGDHEHSHEHAHTHSHGEDDGHEHGFAPWRYIVLVLPIALFGLKLPWPDPPEKLPENLIALKLDTAEQSATSPDQRSFWKTQTETKSVVLKGLFTRPYPTDKGFQFVRLKMTCCAADAYTDPTKVFVHSSKSLNFDDLQKRGPWVKVIGKMTYSPGPDGTYATVIAAESVKPIKTPANQFDN